MNDWKELPADDARFDRLVDGELPAEEYRALLAALEHEPGGWRSCALAFLESQALAGELGGVRQTLDARPPAALAARSDSPMTGLRTLLAMAASFALAFALATAWPRIWNAPPQEPALVGNLNVPGEATGPAAALNQPIGNVQLVMSGPRGEEATREVPIYEINQNLDEYLQQNPPALDQQVLRGLEAQGFHVEVEQQLIPGQLEDGRPMYVPVEQYRITPVNRSF